MTRPDDIPASPGSIPEHVMARARSVAHRDALDTYEEHEESIARAILAAVQEEREACAAIAAAYAKEHAAMAVDALDIDRPLDLATATKASIVAGHIAHAIRNRSVTEGE